MVMNPQSTRRLIVSGWQNIKSKLPPQTSRRVGTLIGKLAKTPIGRKIGVWYDDRSADAFLISFPKCGRTWLRLMIGRSLERYFDLSHPDILMRTLELSQLSSLHPDVPKIVVSHDDDPQWKKPQELEQSKEKYKHAKVILLVRDPRDVIVSNYFEHSKRISADHVKVLSKLEHLKPYVDRIKLYEGDLPTYIHEEIGGFNSLLRFYNIWVENQHVPTGLLLVRYEDIHANPHQEVRRVLNFVGLEQISDEIIAEAVEYASFDNMRKMEEADKFNSLILRPGNKKDEESFKTRKGKVGGFTEYLDEKEIEYVNRQMNEILSDFYGYKP